MAAPDDASSSHLLTMPLEILQQVSWHLTTPEYGNLRLTCKHLEASLLGNFAREFFKKRQFMLTEFSLQALVDISNSRFADGLTHIIMGLDRPCKHWTPPIPHNLSDTELLVAISDGHNKYIEEWTDHIALIFGGQHVDMMTQAFAKLKNLETVEIRDFASRRPRDGTTWNSYGLTTLRRSGGHDPPLGLSGNTEERRDYLSHLFINILRALGKTSTRPRRLEVNLRSGGLDPTAFKIQKYDEDKLVPVLAGLEGLYLDLGAGSVPTHIQDKDSKVVECSSLYLRRFLSLTPLVKHFRLNLFISRDKAQDILSWLCEPPEASCSNSANILPESPPPLRFKSLQKLELGKTIVEPRIILALLQKYKATLQSVHFHRVVLLDSSPPKDRQNQWADLFRRLSKLGLNLGSIAVSLVSQENIEGGHRRHVAFKDCSAHPATRTWAGQDLGGALKDFAKNAVVQWPEVDTESDQESQQDSDMSEDNTEASDDDSDDESDDEVTELLLPYGWAGP